MQQHKCAARYLAYEAFFEHICTRIGEVGWIIGPKECAAIHLFGAAEHACVMVPAGRSKTIRLNTACALYRVRAEAYFAHYKRFVGGIEVEVMISVVGYFVSFRKHAGQHPGRFVHFLTHHKESGSNMHLTQEI